MAVRVKAQFLPNAKHLAARQRTRAKAVDAAMIAGSRGWGEAVKQRAIRLSQGPLKTAELRHIRPGLYSTLNPPSPTFDVVVNMQTGLFARSWRCATWSFSGSVTTTVYNAASYSGFMDGTSRMRQRLVLKAAVYGWPGNPYTAADYARIMAEASAASTASITGANATQTPFTQAIRRVKVATETAYTGGSYGSASFVGDLVSIGTGIIAVYAGEFF